MIAADVKGRYSVLAHLRSITFSVLDKDLYLYREEHAGR